MNKLRLVFDSYLGLIAHDIFMLSHDFSSLHRQIRSFRVRKPGRDAANVESVSHALNVACTFYPKRVLCLQRSSVLVKMLRRRGVPARMVLGAQKLPFKAHAWVEVDEAILDDRLASREKFLVLEVC
jgi:hypothetical protein